MVLALVILALAAATVVGAVLSGGDDEGGSTPRADRAEPAKPTEKKEPAEPKKKSEPKKEEPKAEEPAAAPAPAQPEEETTSYDPARGAELNNEGFALMNQGDYDSAIPILQQAVDSFPPGTGDINYAYALFNLGKSLRLAGRPDEAIPILERRLQIPNQTETVQAELDRAKQEAGQS